MRGKLIFLALWTPLMALSVYTLFFQRPIAPNEGTPLAKIQDQVGDIQYRQDEEILWRPVENNQYVFENDNIATGENSYASLNFGNTQIIELGPNTQIRIRPIGKQGSEFELDLLKGDIAARPGEAADKNVASKQGGGLQIHAGDQTYTLKDEAELGLRKGRGQGELEILMANGKVMLRDKSNKSRAVDEKSNELSLAEQAKRALELAERKKETPPVEKPKKVAAKPKITPIPPPPPPEPPPPPKVVAPVIPTDDPKNFIARLVFPAENQVLWSMSPLENALGKNFPVVLEPPASKPKYSKWQPLLGVGAAEPVPLIEGRPQYRRQVFQVKLPAVREKGGLAKQTNSYVATITPGGRVINRKTGEKAEVYGNPLKVTLQSVPTWKGPLRISLARMQAKGNAHEWFAGASHFEEQAWLYIEDGSQYKNLSAILQGSGGFRFGKSNDLLKGEGVFIVKGRRIIGSLGGKIGNQKALDSIRMALKANAIFKGKADAYIGGLDKFKERALAKTLPMKVYILHDGRFIGVNRDFMTTNPTLRNYLEERTPAFFAEPIVTLSAENFTPEGVSH